MCMFLAEDEKKEMKKVSYLHPILTALIVFDRAHVSFCKQNFHS